MKHSANTTLSFPVAEIKPGGAVLHCSNLHVATQAHNTQPAALTPLTGFSVVAREGNLRPLALFSDTEGTNWTLFCSATPAPDDTYTFYTASSPDNLSAILATSAEPYCAIPSERGWLVMTSDGQLAISSSSPSAAQWKAEWQGVLQPDIAFRGVSCGAASRAVDSLALTDTDFSRERPVLSDASERKLTAALLSAYSELTAIAAENGAWIQPLIARCHIIGRNGMRIFSSEPQLIAPAEWQCCSTITAECSRADSVLSLPAFSLSAAMHKVELHIASLGSFASLADSIEVTLTPQIHPVDFSASAPYRITRPATTTPAITFALPGTTDSLADKSANRALLLASLLARLDSIETLALSSAPAENTVSEITNRQRATATADAAVIPRASVPSPGRVDSSRRSLQSLSAPHSFIARRVASSGATILWADITPILSPPPLPCGTWNEESPSDWTGTLRITFANGTRQLSRIGYPMPMPKSLPPLVSYPDAKAVQLEIWVKKSAIAPFSYASVHLQPSADASRAFFLNPSLEPLPFSEATASSYPEASASSITLGQRVPGMIAVASISAPVSPSAVHNLSTAPVIALHPAVRSNTGWDFTRARFYAFSPAGIFTVSVSANGSAVSTSNIDPRGVALQSHTAYTSSGVMALTASGQLLRIVSARAEEVARDSSGKALAWHPPHERLWLLTSSGLIKAFSLTDFSFITVSPGFSPSMLYPCGDRLLLSDGSRLLQPSDNPPDSQPVRWSSELSLKRAAAMATVFVDLSASLFKGTVTVNCSGYRNDPHPLSLLSLEIDGALLAPLAARVAGIVKPVVTITIAGTASPDFRIDSARLTLT